MPKKNAVDRHRRHRRWIRSTAVSVRGRRRYITKLRVEAAKWLLTEAGEKIEAAAVRVGLLDASHLSRRFVR